MTARYATSNRLDVLRANLSKRDLAILDTLRQYRLASSQQLERWYFTSHATPVAAARAARRSLRRLADFGLISHLHRRIGGVRAGSAGLVWHLTRAGWKLLAAATAVTPPARLDLAEPSLRQADHTLAITEVAVRLHETADAGRCELIELTPEPACWRRYFGPWGANLILKPDLSATTAQPGSNFETIWFLEIDRASESLATIACKVRQYEAYRQSGREQAAQGVFPRVAWIVPDQTRADRIQSALANHQPTPADGHIAVTLDQFIQLVCGDTPTTPSHRGPPPRHSPPHLTSQINQSH